MSVKLKKIADRLSDEGHLANAEAIRQGKFDGISLSYLGEAFGPTWSSSKDYDLNFLKHYEGMRALEIFLPGLTDLEAIADYLNKVEFLSIGEFNKKSVSLKPLAELSSLKSLSLVRNKKDFDVVSGLSGITDLSLTGYQEEQVKSISTMNNLENLYLGFGTLENLNMLEGLSKLRNLGILWVKKLSNINSLEGLDALESIHLGALKQVSNIPNLSKLRGLKSLVIDTMNGISSLAGIHDCSLKELAVINSKIDPSIFSELANHLPMLQRLVVGLDSQGATNEALSGFKPSIICKTFNDLKYYPRRSSRIEFFS